MPSAVVGRQCPALSPTKKTPSSVAGRIWCGIQLPCQRSAGTPTVGARARTVGSLDVVARVEGPDADAQLGVRAGTTRSSRRGRSARSSHSSRSVARPRAGGPPGRATGGPRAAGRPRSSSSTRRQPSASTISGARRSPRSVWTTSPRAPVDLRGLELGVAACRAAARTARGSRRWRTSTAAASGTSGRARGPRARRTSAGSRPPGPRCSSHSVGAAQADVWRSPTS